MAKKMDLQTITVEKIIVHDIPHHKKSEVSVTPNYSEKESGITDGLRLFFKDKVVQALGSDRSFKICFDDESTSTVSWLVSDMLKSGCADIVTTSKAIAKQLFDVQVGNNAAGILVVIFGKVNTKNTCMILKLERDKGAQLTLDPRTHSYNIEEVQDLMLTQKTKIFKVALFVLRDDFSAKFDGVVMDFQIDVKAKKEVVTFFIERFLGCRAFEDPKITTQKFYNLTKAYIDTIPDLVDRAKYIQDLNSYMQKNSHTINPREFADDYLKSSAHKNNYKNFLESKKYKFTASPKDTHLVDNRIKRIVVMFENDISIVGNKGTFDKKVRLTKLENGQTKAEITSKIKKIN
jgi:hypothetical protein